jgi:glutamate synthase (NADPH/NADH) large chain
VNSLWYEKLKSVDLSKILHINKNLGSNKTVMIKDVLANQLDHQLIAQWQSGTLTKKVIPVKNTDRTIGTMLSWAVTKKYGQKGLPQDSILLSLAGTAGQSFGAFLAPGITLQLAGEANDYVGKGLSGGRIIIAPHLKYSSDVIAGNTCLYGATSGELFVAGSVGERFAVRNSGAQAVVEGTGDHACEYMTGGSVIVLGMTGKNFAAGMSGGVAYVLDESSDFHLRCNQLMVEISEVSTDPDFEFLFHQIHRHYLLTGSEKAEKILQSWGHWRGQFKKIISYELLQIQKQQQVQELQLQPSSLSEVEVNL